MKMMKIKMEILWLKEKIENYLNLNVFKIIIL